MIEVLSVVQARENTSPSQAVHSCRSLDADLGEDLLYRQAEAGEHVAADEQITFSQHLNFFAGRMNGHRRRLGVDHPDLSHAVQEIELNLVKEVSDVLTG